jgi:outer membrane receptor protein involved in Fe transport
MKKLVTRKVAVFAQLGSSLLAIVAAGTVVTPTVAVAQLAQAILRGRAAAGAEVVATEVNTGNVRRATVAADGTYVIAGIQPGSYRVTAGSQSADVVITVASTAVVNLDTPDVAQQGDVVVTGSRPTAEVKSSEVNQFVTLHDIAALPQITRNFLEFADTVPGVQFQVDASGNTSLRGGAQLASSVNVYIDGVSQKDFISGGSGITGSGGPQSNGDPGNPFPQLAIAEYKVVTSNYSAAYGDAGSTVLIAQTKSGTNQFHGDSFFEYTDQNLRARTVAEEASNTPKAKQPSKQYGVALGGPIVKDIAHFFFTWEHKSLSNQTTVVPGSGVSPTQAVGLLPTSLSSQYGPVTNPFTENLYFGKIDLEPTDKDRFELTGKFRLENSISGGTGQAAASTQAPFKNNDRRADFRWQHNAAKWTNVALLTYQNTETSTTTDRATPQQQYIYYPNAANATNPTTLLITGGPGSGIGAISRQRGFTGKDDFTLPNVQLAGSHTFRAGFSFGSIKLTSQNASADASSATYYYAVTNAGIAATPFEVQFPLLSAGVTSPSVTTTDKQYSAYVQDDWNVDQHLTINLGVRWDHEVVPAYLNYVTPAYVVAGVNGPFSSTVPQSYASVLAQGNGNTPGYNINDYISTGSNRSAPNNFSPRLGFSYDLFGDNRHVLFGGYARAYNRNLFGTLALEQLKIALNGNPQIDFPSAQTTDSFGACATAADINAANHCYQFNPSYLTPAGLTALQSTIAPNSHEIDLLHNNIRTPHSDQFSLGMRNKIGDWNTQATLSYVESFDGIVGRLGNRYSNGAYFQNGIPWGASGVPGAGSLILFDNGAKDRLLQLGLAAQKPYTRESHWSATISYTMSFADQNNLAGGSNPYAINSNQYLFDLPYASLYPFVRATAVPEHRVVMTYTRDLFWGISGATKVELATPQYATTIFGCAAACNGYGGEALFASRRPNGFLGYKEIDLQLSKDLTFYKSIGGFVRADILNLFNFKNYDPNSVFYDTSLPAGQTGALPYGGVNVNAKPQYNRATYTGLPFTVKFSAGFRF